jgi:hypothetical protein
VDINLKAQTALHIAVAECDYCGAKIGDFCTGVKNKPIQQTHTVRKQAARKWRKENVEAYQKLRRTILEQLKNGL